jgi:predicted TIM-barrel fold metal-dependent hydrolase
MPGRRLAISADSHVVEPPEMFAPLQQRLGSRAPRIVHTDDLGDRLDLGDGRFGLQIGGFLVGGMDLALDETRAQAKRGYAIARPGVYDIGERLKDQDHDGVVAEVLYPSVLFNVYQVEDTEVVHSTFQAYNDWLYDYVKPAPDRLYGLGAIQLRDLDWAIDELKRVKEMGYVGLSIPCTAPPDKPFSDRFYDPFWAAAEEAQMPLTMHIFSSAAPMHGVPSVPGAESPLAHVGMEATLMHLIAWGVLERFPGLKFVVTEFETGWIGNFLRRTDHTWTRHGGRIAGATLPRKPSEYWHRQFIATFEDDPIGIRTRDFIGTANLMWGSDYPHGDSIFPESQPILDSLFGPDEEHDRFLLTAANVTQLYNLPFDLGRHTPQPAATPVAAPSG